MVRQIFAYAPIESQYSERIQTFIFRYFKRINNVLRIATTGQYNE